jgi:hypothetical protein
LGGFWFGPRLDAVCCRALLRAEARVPAELLANSCRIWSLWSVGFDGFVGATWQLRNGLWFWLICGLLWSQELLRVESRASAFAKAAADEAGEKRLAVVSHLAKVKRNQQLERLINFEIYGTHL